MTETKVRHIKCPKPGCEYTHGAWKKGLPHYTHCPEHLEEWQGSEFMKKVRARVKRDREENPGYLYPWERKEKLKHLREETGIDFTNDYTRYHWNECDEGFVGHDRVTYFGDPEALSDHVYQGYQHFDRDRHERYDR